MQFRDGLRTFGPQDRQRAKMRIISHLFTQKMLQVMMKYVTSKYNTQPKSIPSKSEGQREILSSTENSPMERRQQKTWQIDKDEK